MKSFPIYPKAISVFCSLTLALLLAACSDSPTAQSTAIPAAATIDVAKSPNDRRDYRALVLENGMKVVLISDPATEKAAAAVDVDAGSNSDPDDFPGLAHFLEHMLFLGTEAYPAAGEYQEFITSRGGSNNAYTAHENTNYYFDIDSPWLEPALDRFAQFFIAPLFTQDYVDRERNAVHSEYQSGLQDDGRRAYSVLKQVINPAHSLARFSVGSLDTLQDRESMSLRDALLKQYHDFYSAEHMSVAVIGRESLDELESMVRSHFGQVARRGAGVTTDMESLFSNDTLPALLEISPIRDQRSLTFTFPIPLMQEHYKAKPLQYLGNMLGHEGEGSLLSLLRKQGWANGLSAGGGFAYRDAATFAVNVALTEAGVEHVDEISALVFRFITLVREEGIHEWLFDEQRLMADLAFRFQEPANPRSLVSSLSRRLQEYPAAELISAPYAYEDWQPALLEAVLDHLRPDNVLMTFTSRTVTPDTTDPWYGAGYRFTPLEQERLQAWQHHPLQTELAIAAPNPFLPEDLALKPLLEAPLPEGVNPATVKPALLRDAGGIRVWFRQDAEFLVPRANFFVYAMTPLFSESLRSSLLAAFVMSLVNDQLNEFSYPANLAGSYFGINARSRGFTLSVNGYSDKQEVLLEELLRSLGAAEFEQERFDIIKTEMLRGWQNAALRTPYIRLFDEVRALLAEPYWPEEEKIAEVANITLQEVKDFVPRLLEGLRLDVLYHGNVVPDDLDRMLPVLERYLRVDPDAALPSYGTVVKLPESARIVQELEIDHEDSAIVIYRQGPDDSLRTRALMQLLGTMLSTPFYETLRTQEQLGYIVNAGTMQLLDTSGLIMYIESPATNPLLLEARIDVFLAAYAERLSAMDTEFFEGIKAGLLTSLREPPQRLNALSNRYWSDILTGDFEEDSTLQLASAIEALTLEEVTELFREHVARSSGRVVARSAGKAMREGFEAARQEQADTIVLRGFADYRRFKQQSEHYEFR
jgi:insulysin